MYRVGLIIFYTVNNTLFIHALYIRITELALIMLSTIQLVELTADVMTYEHAAVFFMKT